MTSTTNTSSQDPKAPCGIWTLHSEIENRPMLRGFAKTKADAEKRMKELSADEPDSKFWLIELTHGELQDFRDYGMLPPGF
jgi:hypothetical protein